MLKIVVCDDDALCCKEIVKGIRDTLGSTPADISDFRDPTLLLEHLRKTDCQPHIALLDIDLVFVDETRFIGAARHEESKRRQKGKACVTHGRFRG